MSQVRQNWLNANKVVLQQLDREPRPDVRLLFAEKSELQGQADDRHQVRLAAMGNVGKFHQAQLFGSSNLACLDENRAEALADRGQARVLQRKVSFLSIAPQLGDLDRLTDTAPGQLLRRMDAATQVTLEEILKTIQLNHRIVETDAVSAARNGLRGLPLTIDNARFHGFLSKHEALLSDIVDACSQSHGRVERLQPLLQQLATDYFAEAKRLPPAQTAGHHRRSGQSVDVEPLEVVIGNFKESGGQHLFEKATGYEQILLTIGAPVVSGPPAALAPMLKGFENADIAKQRAALVLQTLFYSMTDVEEKIIAAGLHCRTGLGHRQSRATTEELGYSGSTIAGDACDFLRGGPTQREQASAPLRKLPETLRAHQAAHQAPLLSNANLTAWIADPSFQLDILSMTTPALRLPNAQVATTAALLADSRAFGGNGSIPR